MAKVKLTQTANRERAFEVYDRLAKEYPDVRCTLDYSNAFELLIMTILAAQCTDARVNIVCKDLFPKYPTPREFLETTPAELEAAVQPCGFYKNKAKNIRATCEILVNEYGGEVPPEMDQLVRLPGVGRKTANVLRGECFGGQGVVVDTHCTRLANRLGFTKNQDAVKIEKDLMKVWPSDRWTLMSHFMVFHGRACCTARAPRCSQCVLVDLCPFPDTREGKKLAR
jgi:endonuclease-3